MTRDAIMERLAPIIRDVLERPDIVLSYETSAEDIEEWDSVNHINLMIAVESRFGVTFATSEIQDLKNVGELVDLIIDKGGR